MDFAIFYFSGTGNTKWATEELKGYITEKGNTCGLYSIEDVSANLEGVLKNAQTIGFAFPIYGAGMPDVMARFIGSLKNIAGWHNPKTAFVMTTAGYMDAYGPFAAGRILKNSGLLLEGYVNIKMSNNISTPKLKAGFQTREGLKSRMENGRLEIKKLVEDMTAGKKHICNVGPYLIPGMLIRKAAGKGLRNNYLELGVDREKCSGCMQCVGNCPTNSIVFSDGKFSFLPSCTACMRCYNYCPSHAVCHGGQYADPKIYKRYLGPGSITG